ncbi:hypothetical protein HPB47_002901 [Ixodes persulcatus]|uniref:Uncharacterized protein n=1 Tax=Ixodes persulcatus TaxID=34615 RepID=A0AC60PJV9_IXOPE|nr:hypothetical protein HPB47_002901 [Ixodes persulcatus]
MISSGRSRDRIAARSGHDQARWAKVARAPSLQSCYKPVDLLWLHVAIRAGWIVVRSKTEDSHSTTQPRRKRVRVLGQKFLEPNTPFVSDGRAVLVRVQFRVIVEGGGLAIVGLDERPGQNMFAHAGPRNWSAVVKRWSHAQPQFGTSSRSNGTIQLKPSVLSQAFETATSLRERCQLLTLLPSTLTKNEVQKMIPQASMYLISKSRKLKENHGVWYEPDPYTRCKVSPENVSAALEYFTKDELQCSRQSPNKKDVISVMLNGEKTGNELSQHVYLAGEACSQCPKGTCCSSSSCPPARTSAANASPAAFTGLCRKATSASSLL